MLRRFAKQGASVDQKAPAGPASAFMFAVFLAEPCAQHDSGALLD